MSDLITRRFLHNVMNVHMTCRRCGLEQDVPVSVTVGVDISVAPVVCAYCEHRINYTDANGKIPSEIVKFIEGGVEKEGVAYFHPTTCQESYHKSLKLSGRIYPIDDGSSDEIGKEGL